MVDGIAEQLKFGTVCVSFRRSKLGTVLCYTHSLDISCVYHGVNVRVALAEARKMELKGHGGASLLRTTALVRNILPFLLFVASLDEP